VETLGKKGSLTALLREVGTLPLKERRERGARINAVKASLEQALAERLKVLQTESREALAISEWVDMTYPGTPLSRGHIHPVSQVTAAVRQIFSRIGYEVAEGPEVELDYYNFEALNIPKGHPVRDVQDSLYLAEEGVAFENLLLRTQTSPVQIRTMQQRKPPIRVITPGRVYRRENADATRGVMFHQVEGLLVDDDISVGDLIGTLEYFARSMFGAERRVRFVSDYFPFTEPSLGMAISCGICRGEGCRSCRQSGWLEILGSGMVHPQVLRNGGIDPERYSGFAFGMGLDRIAMLKYNIEDIRLLFESDVRFLKQF
jgi:phenylalanyl-tRNA synthetase alpha chain